eukprot:909457-Pleurochrysis_carterae.AAC.1
MSKGRARTAELYVDGEGGGAGYTATGPGSTGAGANAGTTLAGLLQQGARSEAAAHAAARAAGLGLTGALCDRRSNEWSEAEPSAQHARAQWVGRQAGWPRRSPGGRTSSRRRAADPSWTRRSLAGPRITTRRWRFSRNTYGVHSNLFLS